MMKIKIIYARMRYEFYRLFFPKKIKESISKRKGKCECGKAICCRGCIYLDKDNRCSVYEERIAFQPRCRVYPFDIKDKKLTYPDICTYYWDEEKNNSR